MRPPQRRTSEVAELLGGIGRGRGQSCERQRVLLILLRRTPSQAPGLDGATPGIEGSELTPLQNLLRGPSVARWVRLPEHKWVNADERQGEVPIDDERDIDALLEKNFDSADRWRARPRAWQDPGNALALLSQSR